MFGLALSFVLNSLKDCPTKNYKALLIHYLEMGEKYKLEINFSHVLSVYHALSEKIVIQEFEQPKNAYILIPNADTLMANYTWNNGFEFLEQLFEKNGDFRKDLVRDDSFIQMTYLMSLNHNAYVSKGYSEHKKLLTLLSSLFLEMQPEQYNHFYQKIDMHVNNNNTPLFRMLIDKFYLEHNTKPNESSEGHKNIKKKI